MPEDAFIALGANEGDREKTLAAALRLLSEEGVQVTAVSSLYETEPLGPPGQPLYLNGAARLQTEMEPLDLLRLLLKTEKNLGRERSGLKWGPRPVDLDLIFFGSRRMEEKELTLPHPEYSRRTFVLIPLLEMEPDLKDPSGTRLEERLKALGVPRGIRLYKKRWYPVETARTP